MTDRSKWRSAATLALLVLAFGCEAPAPEVPAAGATTTQLTPEKVEQKVEEKQDEAKPTGWGPVAEDALTDPQKAQLEKARMAQKAMGGMLMKALSQSIADNGFVDSIEVCAGLAPDAAAQVGVEHGVKIGRTSKKLRNPKNAAPAWAADAVAADEAKPQFFSSSAGQLAVMSPIKTAALCVNCHGAPDKLVEGIPAALAAKYPEDRATGFAENELRGWFWVEVAP